MKLLSITLPHMPLFGSPSNVNCDAPPANLKGFSIRVRGRAVFLVSPPGWTNEKRLPSQHDPKGPRRMFGPFEAGAECIMQWDSDDIDAAAKYDGEPMGMPVEVLSDEEMERATAPRGKAVGR